MLNSKPFLLGENNAGSLMLGKDKLSFIVYYRILSHEMSIIAWDTACIKERETVSQSLPADL